MSASSTLPKLFAFALSSAAVFSLASSATARPELLFEAPREVAFDLDAPGRPRFDLLLPFREAAVEKLGPFRLYSTGPYGSWMAEPVFHLTWTGDSTEIVGARRDAPSSGAPDEDDDGLNALPVLRDRGWAGFEKAFAPPLFDFTGSSLITDGYGDIFALPPTKPVIDWRCRRRPVLMLRYGAESDHFDLVRCDGSMAPFALDRLSILARPPEAARPEGGALPDEPDPDAWSKRHEWVDGVRVMNPRLVWAMQKISDAFPWKAVYVYSGYRPFSKVNDGTGHESMHALGRALDISVYQVPNEELFKVCHQLKDVGCGYYPNSKFVHVDVRAPGSGQAIWIDDSAPGEPAHYLDSWPGVVESGGMAWVHKE